MSHNWVHNKIRENSTLHSNRRQKNYLPTDGGRVFEVVWSYNGDESTITCNLSWTKVLDNNSNNQDSLFKQHKTSEINSIWPTPQKKLHSWTGKLHIRIEVKKENDDRTISRKILKISMLGQLPDRAPCRNSTKYVTSGINSNQISTYKLQKQRQNHFYNFSRQPLIFT